MNQHVDPELDGVLESLVAYREFFGDDAMWELVPRGVRGLTERLEMDGIEPEYALETALKVAVGWR